MRHKRGLNQPNAPWNSSRDNNLTNQQSQIQNNKPSQPQRRTCLGRRHDNQNRHANRGNG